MCTIVDLDVQEKLSSIELNQKLVRISPKSNKLSGWKVNQLKYCGWMKVNLLKYWEF